MIKLLEGQGIKRRRQRKNDFRRGANVKVTRRAWNVLGVYAAEKPYIKTLKDYLEAEEEGAGAISIPA